MSVDPANNNPVNPQGQGLALGRVTNALETIIDFMLPGVSFEQAVQDAVDSGALRPDDIDFGALSERINDMPPGHQRQLSDNATSLPPELRAVMDRLGLSQTDVPDSGEAANRGWARADSPGAGPASGNSAMRGEGAAAYAQLQSAPGTGAAQNTNAPGAALAANASPNAVPAAADARAAAEVQMQQPPRGSDALLSPSRADALAPGADRLAALQTHQAVLAPQGRTDALPAQVLPQMAGATMLANPQGTVAALPGVAPTPPGSDAAAAQARDNQLAPSGHTLAGSLRRDLRKGAQTPREQRADPLLPLIPGLRKRRGEVDEPATSFQWMFWVLTVAAYGALAVAVIAMIPSGGGLTDDFGRPTYGAYALAVGAVAAVASWFVGRRLARR